MDIPNAFVGKATQPTLTEVSDVLGSTAEVWQQFVEWAAQEHGVTIQDWKSISPKYGWSLRLKLKKRTIVYLSPCNGCFRVMFILGDRAIEAARQSALPKSALKAIDDAPHYPEGTGLRFTIRRAKDLPTVRKLVAVKLGN